MLDHDLGLACCVAGVVVLGLLGLLAPIIRLRRMFVGRKRVSEARSDALVGIRQLLDPQGRGLVTGSPDHFYVRINAAQIEVTLTTSRTDARYGLSAPQPLIGDIDVVGHHSLCAAWINGSGPRFQMRGLVRATGRPRTFDEAYEVEGDHAALVREWFLTGPLDSAAAQIYPSGISSDGATVRMGGRGANPDANRLAAMARVLAAMVEAAAG